MTAKGPRRARFWRLGALAVCVIAAIVWALTSGVFSGVTTQSIRERVQAAGTWAMLAFVLAYGFGILIHLPGVAFNVAAVALWGAFPGLLVAYLGGLLAITVPFLLVRLVAGPALADVERPLVRKLIDRVAARPMTTVFALRLFFWTGPVPSYALPLTPITFRDYFAGSAAGIALPICATGLVGRALFW